MVTMLTIQIASATQLDCEEVVTTTNIPCQIITAYKYTNACNTYTIKFYNSTPTLVGQKLLNNYGATGRCNTSFNFTEVDSYIFNISSGDSGRIIVEVDETMNLAITIALTAFSIVFVGIGLYLWYRGRKDTEEE